MQQPVVQVNGSLGSLLNSTLNNVNSDDGVSECSVVNSDTSSHIESPEVTFLSFTTANITCKNSKFTRPGYYTDLSGKPSASQVDSAFYPLWDGKMTVSFRA